jgi:flagellar hook-length control protein FliK
MLDMNTLILNSCKVTDSGNTIQPQIKSDELQEFKEEQNDNELLITQGSFILLLTELFSRISTDMEGSIEESDVLNKKSEASNDRKVISNFETDEPVLEYISPEQLQSDQITGSVQFNQTPIIKLDPNVALTWIEYEHFEPPLAASLTNIDADQILSGMEHIAVEQTNEQTKFAMSFINEEQKSDPDINELSQNDASPEHEESFFQKLNHIDMDSVETLTEAPEMIKSIIEKSVRTVGQTLENSQSTVQSDLINNQLNQSIPESIKPKTLDITVPLSDAQWADKFSEHIVWLGHQGIKSAIIKINPEDLGPLEISVKVVKESASVNITSHSGHVRDIVDQALPRLREMMADQGLDLTEVTYETGTSADSRQSDHQNNDTKNEMMFDAEEGTLVTSLTKRPPKGLIDYFA